LHVAHVNDGTTRIILAQSGTLELLSRNRFRRDLWVVDRNTGQPDSRPRRIRFTGPYWHTPTGLHLQFRDEHGALIEQDYEAVENGQQLWGLEVYFTGLSSGYATYLRQ